MVSFDPKVKNEYTGFISTQKVGGVNPFAPAEGTQFKGGEVNNSGKGWEKYHSGQGPNGLNGGFLSDGTGDNGAHKLNMYF